MRLLVPQRGEWRILAEEAHVQILSFVFRRGLPVYGESTQELSFPVTFANALRLELKRPNQDPGRYWSISEMELYLFLKTMG